MFCTSCGTRLEDTAKFCVSCGKPTTLLGAPVAGAEPNRRLVRIMARKKVAGVCAGFAVYFDMDLTLMRLIWVGLLLIPPHIGLIAYIISWAVLPKDESLGAA
ncbi:MAG: phage shock protein PspC [Bryobacterales bacterium]|nr:phage shock protein PspC [Bryobacterales bacterium]